MDNRTIIDFTRDATEKLSDGFHSCMVHKLFEAQAVRTPDATAVQFRGTELTYKELNRQANKLALRLQKNGVEPGSLVGIYIERSLDMMAAILAVLKSGAGYIPIEPPQPPRRLAFLLNQAPIALLLTRNWLVESVPTQHIVVLCVDSEFDQCTSSRDDDSPDVDISHTSLAYVAYTSGSSGEPKGVMVSHGALALRFDWLVRQFQLTSRDRVLRKAPFGTGNAAWEFLLPLVVGGQSIIAPPGLQRGAAATVRLLKEQKITCVHFVPSMLSLILDIGLDHCEGLRLVVSDGEPLPTDLRDRFFLQTSAELHNLYGQTETCIAVSAWKCERSRKRPIVPIGSPAIDTQIYVLDRSLKPAGINENGELFIGGKGLARGYLGDPQLTSQRFIQDPFNHSPGARLFRTGDLGRYLPDGNIEFMGRLDEQIKIRGFRVELPEIRKALLQHPHVKEVVVRALGNSLANKRLVAYYTANSGDELTAPNLRGFLDQRLPDYMLPVDYIHLVKMPLTDSGKINHQALPEPTGSRPGNLGVPHVAPSSALESVIASIWQEVLAIENIGVLDNFFYLGGDSLRVIQCIHRVERHFGTHIPATILFDIPTIYEFANYLVETCPQDIHALEAIASRPFEME